MELEQGGTLLTREAGCGCVQKLLSSPKTQDKYHYKSLLLENLAAGGAGGGRGWTGSSEASISLLSSVTWEEGRQVKTGPGEFKADRRAGA